MKTKKILKVALLFTLILSVIIPVSPSYASSASPPSFLMNTNKIYTYVSYSRDDNKRFYSTASFIGKTDKKDIWAFKDEGEIVSIKSIFFQDKDGLKMGSFYEGKWYWYKQLGLPLVEKNTWDFGHGQMQQIISLNKTVKTSAGTFYNCVEIAEPGGVSYYAPNAGEVLFVGKAGGITELVKIEDSHIGRVLIKQKDIKLYNPKGKVHRTLKKGEGLKVFKENNDSFDVGGGYYVKKSKNTLFYTGSIYNVDKQMNIYSTKGKLYKKVPIGNTIRVYGFEDGKYLIGGGYYINFDYYIQYDK
ncbi:hypothetical protein [Metabacillus fastidiosus]|uniref:Uncharacterized protein n=1 Tax=Metabacillus fastidiosus TaxID=1458 RepID=A0ABU6NW36_9BACI|nr:hypothetical protein [Metabacillus fastidiosus]MED4401344.1 hypothetical protein [Metabacillus fastidiosus]MED4461705.1 hypothetical protein [Metabacillus fastidiosus]